ncbi:cupin domain-containing protein [Francisellaceae bacterium CB300]|jgi:50S ribosomal protein L16 3-hydroxylase
MYNNYITFISKLFMFSNSKITKEIFINEYWQKKPLLIKNAFPNFESPISADELAGLSLEDGIESRVVTYDRSLGKQNQYKVFNGPFEEDFYQNLQKDNYTLLVQGVDKIVPEVCELFSKFNFIPQWRIDDVMISYAEKGGNVGPHYDNYDVFIMQAEGQRTWSLTSKKCNIENYVDKTAIRLMDSFIVEEEYTLEAGDILYIPAEIGHHGISDTHESLSYSFGYRSYQAMELWESFGDYLSEKNTASNLFYKDPNWNDISSTGEISESAIAEAKSLMQKLLDDNYNFKQWFGKFVTSIDASSEELLPETLHNNRNATIDNFLCELLSSDGLVKDTTCRMSYTLANEYSKFELFVNGNEWDIENVDTKLIMLVANNYSVSITKLKPFIEKPDNLVFLFELWKLQWLYI